MEPETKAKLRKCTFIKINFLTDLIGETKGRLRLLLNLPNLGEKKDNCEQSMVAKTWRGAVGERKVASQAVGRWKASCSRLLACHSVEPLLLLLLIAVEQHRLSPRLDVRLEIQGGPFEPCPHFYPVGVVLHGPGQKYGASGDVVEFFGKVFDLKQRSYGKQKIFMWVQP